MQFVKDRLESGDCDLLILDEVMGSIKNKLIDVDKLVSMLKNRKLIWKLYLQEEMFN